MSIKSTFLSLLVFGLFAMSCSKDDNILTTQNNVLLDGQPFDVTTAVILGVSMNGSGHATVTFSSTSGTTSKTLTIDVEYSGNSSVEGVYSYPQAGSDLYLDDFLTSYLVSDNTTNTLVQLTSGNVTITKNAESNYTVDMDLTMDDGSHFTGSYKGVFIVSFNNS